MRSRVAAAVPHSPWPVDDIVAVRNKLEQLAREQRFDEAIAMMLDLVVRVRDDNTALRVRLHDALRQLYGRRTEKVSADQLSLLFKLLNDDVPEGAAQIAAEAQQGDSDDSDASNDATGDERPDPQKSEQPEHARHPGCWV